MGQSETITVLFTDIVGSTDHLVRLGDRAWDDVRRSHFLVLRDALRAHDGTEVKNTGDGLMAVFTSVVQAVHCSIAMQLGAQQVVVGGAPVGIRIGISTGEASQDQGDWFGTPVVEAARLCANAGTNEAWATGLVEALAGSSGLYRLPANGIPELVLSGPGLVGVAFDRQGGAVVCSNDTAYRLWSAP